MTKNKFSSWYRVSEIEKMIYIAASDTEAYTMKVVIGLRTEERQGQASNIIPTKVQRIGNPGKMTALYIEDYVYTFLKQLMLLKEKELIVDIYGHQVKNQKKNHVIIMAAKEQEITQEEYEQDKTIFPDLHRIGSIHMDTNRRSFQNGVLQMTLDGENKQNINGFYVFYDKNEPMQNYLIAWHQRGNQEKDPSEMTVKYAKKLQQNQFYHAKDQYWKQCITAVCASLFVILSVMAITVINNYQKMLSLQDHVSYIVECMADDHSQVETVLHQNADVLSRLFQDESEWQTDTEKETEEGSSTDAQPTEEKTEMQPKASDENTTQEDLQKESDATNQTATEKNAADTDQTVNMENTTSNTDQPASAESAASNIDQSANAEHAASNADQTAKTDADSVVKEPAKDSTETNITSDEGTSTYSVAEGDTLQSILYRQYGTLNKMEQVCELNQITDPDAIRIGQKLYLP